MNCIGYHSTLTQALTRNLRDVSARQCKRYRRFLFQTVCKAFWALNSLNIGRSISPLGRRELYKRLSLQILAWKMPSVALASPWKRCLSRHLIPSSPKVNVKTIGEEISDVDRSDLARVTYSRRNSGEIPTLDWENRRQWTGFGCLLCLFRLYWHHQEFWQDTRCLKTSESGESYFLKQVDGCCHCKHVHGALPRAWGGVVDAIVIFDWLVTPAYIWQFVCWEIIDVYATSFLESLLSLKWRWDLGPTQNRCSTPTRPSVPSLTHFDAPPLTLGIRQDAHISIGQRLRLTLPVTAA